MLVETWILTVKPVYTLQNVSDDLKWTTNRHVTPFTLISKAKLTISMVLENLCFLVDFLPVHHPPSTTVFTPLNYGWTSLHNVMCTTTVTTGQTCMLMVEYFVVDVDNINV